MDSSLFVYFAFFIFIAVAIVINSRCLVLPNKLNLIGFLVAMLFAASGQMVGREGSIANALMGAAVGFAITIFFYVHHKMGAGDVKFTLVLGAFLGSERILIAGLTAVGFSLLLLLLVYLKKFSPKNDQEEVIFPVAILIGLGAAVVAVVL